MAEECVSASEAARILQVSADGVRFFEKRKMLSPIATSQSGWKLYRREDVEKLAAQRMVHPPRRGRKHA